jgi:hypothetical protein
MKLSDTYWIDIFAYNLSDVIDPFFFIKNPLAIVRRDFFVLKTSETIHHSFFIFHSNIFHISLHSNLLHDRRKDISLVDSFPCEHSHIWYTFVQHLLLFLVMCLLSIDREPLGILLHDALLRER